MSVLFDEVDDYYVVPDSADLVLDDIQPWCFGLWVNVEQVSGGGFQYAFSQGPLGTNGIHLYMAETTGRWFLHFWDSEGNPTALQTEQYGADGVDRLIIGQHFGGSVNGAVNLWTCPAGGEVVDEAFDSIFFEGLDAAGSLRIGARADGNADRYYGNVLGEFFKGTFTLGESEVEAMAAGQSILDIGKEPDIYLPFVSAAATISDQSGNGNDATRQGDPQTVTPHFIGAGAGGAVAGAAHLQRMRQG